MGEHDNQRELIWKIYCELGVSERHFNGIQSGYRALASTWMLAAFAGIGFVGSKEFTFGIPKELLVGVIGVGGGIGVYLLWVLDLLFCQRLLDAAYIEGRNLEDKHDWLPQIRNNMRALLGGKGLSLVVWYYIAGTEVMFLIGGIGLLWFFATRENTAHFAVGALAYAVLLITIPVHIKRKTSITPELEAKILAERTRRTPVVRAE